MTTRNLVLTDGNIRNAHIYLRSVRDLLPADAIGGPDKGEAARSLTVSFDGGETVESDVAGDKMILRERGAVRRFLAEHRAQAGDEMVLGFSGDRTISVSFRRAR
jgi:hypothetical protein